MKWPSSPPLPAADVNTFIEVQEQDFSHAELYRALAHGTQAGAVVTFTGRVRDFVEATPGGQSMWLEHYPAMTEKTLNNIIERARERWPILDVSVVHRIGKLHPGDQIVFVGVSSAHRKAAFAASEFIMDFLKTEAPFWKKEGAHWVDAKASDSQAAADWGNTSITLNNDPATD